VLVKDADMGLASIHRGSAVIHERPSRVDGLGTNFVGNPMETPGICLQHLACAASAITASLANAAVGGGGE
jgi:hypothetical protein